MLALLSSNISVSPVHSVPVSIVSIVPVYPLVLCSAPSVSQSFFIITEKAPTRAFPWLKAPTSAFTFKTLLRHYAKQALTPR